MVNYKSFKLRSSILHWFRCVDYIFNIVKGDRYIFDDFLRDLNAVHLWISFTIEVEKEAIQNFLDLTVKHSYDRLSFNIYRKAFETIASVQPLCTDFENRNNFSVYLKDYATLLRLLVK